MAKFVDQVEKQIATRYKPGPLKKSLNPYLDQDRAGIPEFAFSTNILDSGLDEHINIILQEAGYTIPLEILPYKFARILMRS